MKTAFFSRKDRDLQHVNRTGWRSMDPHSAVLVNPVAPVQGEGRQDAGERQRATARKVPPGHYNRPFGQSWGRPRNSARNPAPIRLLPWNGPAARAGIETKETDEHILT